MHISASDIPPRLATGAYIAHSGWEKWHGGAEQAQGVQGMAAGAFPFLKKIPPATFLKVLAAAELAIGGALLAPVVSNRVAGLGLTGFAAGLLGLYWRTPGMHKDGSIWPTQAGTGISKDVWMLGIGVGLVARPSAESVD